MGWMGRPMRGHRKGPGETVRQYSGNADGQTEVAESEQYFGSRINKF